MKLKSERCPICGEIMDEAARETFKINITGCDDMGLYLLLSKPICARCAEILQRDLGDK